MSRAILLPTLIATCTLVSCATVSKIGQGSMALVQKTSEATTAKVAQLADIVHPPGVKVVEVREKDLKPLPTGQERALAYQNTRKRGFWFFGGPVDFKEPTLPEPGGEMDGSLLPPKDP
jgi:hypothetical protein